jgi:AraC-like DNA-binding protein
MMYLDRADEVVQVGDEVAVRRVSTSTVPVADRYAYWQESMSSSLYPVRLSPAGPVDGGKRADFRADFLRVDAGPAKIARGVLDPVRSEITPASARQRSGDTVQIMLHEGGKILLESRQGRQVLTGRTLTVQSDDEPAVQTHTERVPMVLLSVEASRLSVPMAALRPSMFVPHPVDGMLRALVLGAAETARHSAGQLDPVGMTSYLSGVAELVLRTLVGHQTEHLGTVEVRRQQVHELVRARFHDPHLTTTAVAEAVGVSVRRLHQLFAGGPTVAVQIRTARLERAVELLSDPMWAAQPVSVVAQRCGFLDHSQFSRAFRQHTGTTPRSFRA